MNVRKIPPRALDTHRWCVIYYNYIVKTTLLLTREKFRVDSQSILFSLYYENKIHGGFS